MKIEIHNPITKDGYHLFLQRFTNNNGNPVILWHGMSNGSEMFSNCESNLALYLHSRGYDVWLANCRGTKYSKRHESKSASEADYWDFSIDEYAELDCPCVIDHVLEVTGFTQVSYIGFSQGVALVLASLSLNEELNHKINIMIGLGPAMRPKPIQNKIVNYITKKFGSDSVFTMFGRRAFVPIASTISDHCPSFVTRHIIQNAMRFLFGWNLDNWGDTNRRNVLVRNVFSTTSVKTLVVKY